MCGDRINSVEHSKYHSCWCPGSLRRQDISTHDIDYIEWISSCHTCGMISTTSIMSMWTDDIKRKYMFAFPPKISARKGIKNAKIYNLFESDMPILKSYKILDTLIYIVSDKWQSNALTKAKATFTLCPSPCPSPCPYQSPCPNNSHFLIKLEAVFRLHQFPYQSPIQCHQISVRSVSISPPTVKNWYGRPFPSESCNSLYKNHTLTSGEAVVDIKLIENWQEFWFSVNGATDTETEADTETDSDTDTVWTYL